MVHNLESNYDCSNAGSDIHELQEQLQALKSGSDGSKESAEQINRLENQIHFIKNKCDIHP
ncbi:DUF2524 domain-containing protein [Paenibacillus doosanensis]|uniref:DUF2524 domain-containing protein n=1 Tax=Paenibacillus konkukensis TaxID=2020716 RepID=A0ABY4RIM0_9BACL|nr:MULTISPECIES: DUF2524 domain-containing protein [Paenibacillus]MCS7461612.1 DUF2524 domain-containing protein [Paenibacillus doosanensis]UQZ82037.1 hypothetical protein SK3146_01194 [Paenibacillus konkukensis]